MKLSLSLCSRCLLQEDASNITILGLLLECSLPKSLFSSPQVFIHHHV